jgi:hypothetical protein
MTVSLPRQIARAQLTIQGNRARLEQCEGMAARGRWPAGDLEMKRLEIVENEAILRTLRWLEEHEMSIRAAILEASQ